MEGRWLEPTRTMDLLKRLFICSNCALVGNSFKMLSSLPQGCGSHSLFPGTWLDHLLPRSKGARSLSLLFKRSWQKCHGRQLLGSALRNRGLGSLGWEEAMEGRRGHQGLPSQGLTAICRPVIIPGQPCVPSALSLNSSSAKWDTYPNASPQTVCYNSK